MLVPTTRIRDRKIVQYLEIAWNILTEERSPQEEPDDQAIGRVMKKFRNLRMSTFPLFKPAIQPKPDQTLCCLLLKRVYGKERDPGKASRRRLPCSRTTVIDYGIVCEYVGPSNKHLRRVGSFYEVVNDDPQDYGLYDTQFYFNHMGDTLDEEDVSRHWYSLPAEVQNQRSGRSPEPQLQHFSDPETCTLGTNQGGLKKLPEKLSMFKDAYEEAGVNII